MNTTATTPTGHPPELDAEAAARKKAKAETIGRYVAMFLMPLIMVVMMVGGYLAAMHAPTPHHMPIAVSGAPASANGFAKALESADPEAVDVRITSDAGAARQLVLDRMVTASVVIDGPAATLYTAGSAGASQASAVTALLAPQIMGQGLKMSAEDLAPLPENDKSGLGAMFLTTALVMAGYLPFSLTLSNSPELLRFRRALPLLAGWSTLIASLVWAVTGPLLGVVTPDHAWAMVGVSWLGVFAIGAVQLLLTRLLGPLAILVAMFLLMVLGVPASNMGLSVYTMPGIYTYFHSFLPTPALGEALRSVLYFEGAGTWGYLAVLVIGAVIALGLTLGFDARRRRTKPNAPAPVIGVPSLHGGKRPKTRFWRYTALLVFPLGMVIMMVSFMLGAMAEPTPREMPVAISAPTVATAAQTVDSLQESMPGLFDLRAVDSGEEARTMVAERTVSGAMVMPAAPGEPALLLTNEAAGSSAHQLITQIFGQVAAGNGMELVSQDVAPLPSGDSAGTVSMYMAMGWIMSGFMIIVVGASAAPASRPLRKLLPIVAGWSVFMSALLWWIAGPVIGGFSGHFWAMFGTGIIAIFTVAMFATVFERLMGMLSILPVVAILMFLGIPASGAALSIYMQPEVFSVLHGILPMPAAVEAVRSILYFGSDVVGAQLVTFGIWGAVSLAAVLVIDRFKPVRTTTEVVSSAQPEPARANAPEDQKELAAL
ncbi:MAG: ABC transporter permease [Micrococcaceae bacterium]|nr:ABC transporter permease [Micrococcaceae bacterium]